jgi:hypothetical protein
LAGHATIVAVTRSLLWRDRTIDLLLVASCGCHASALA